MNSLRSHLRQEQSPISWSSAIFVTESSPNSQFRARCGHARRRDAGGRQPGFEPLGNILDFQDFDLITPNEREARFALGDQDSTVGLPLDLYKKAGCKFLMLKLGDRGIITYRAPNPDVRSFFTVDSFADRVVDAVGAGDALLSYATLSMAATSRM